MKRAMALLLTTTILVASCIGLVSCRDTDQTKPETKLENKSEVLLDFNNAQNIPSDLVAQTTDVKTATNSAKWNGVYNNYVEFELQKNDLSKFKEVSVWINNPQDSKITAEIYLVSDNASTELTDCYYADITFVPGWNRYDIPIVEITAKVVGTPLGLTNISGIGFKGKFSGGFQMPNVSLVFDSFYANSQRTGTLKGFSLSDAENAVCFYEDSNAYLYNQLRYVLDFNEDIAVYADDKTTYVPVQILAEHRGATNITASKDSVSFTYNGQSYTFTPEFSVDFTGDPNGFAAGKNFSVKPYVSGNYIMLPMEYCAEIFGYKLAYDKMGLAVFNDLKTVLHSYSGISDSGFARLYDIIEVIAFNKYTGAEIIDNMNTLYPDDTHTRILSNQNDFDTLKELVKTDPTYAAWLTKFEAAWGVGSARYNTAPNSRFYLSDGFRLLSMSRDVMDRIMAWATLYKITDNNLYAEKVWTEVNALTRYTDPMTKTKSWHPEHFLDTGEIMYPFAVAYDWLYDYWTPERRATMEAAVWEMGYGAAMGFGALAEWWENGQENIKNYLIEIGEYDETDTRKYNTYTGYSYSAPYPKATFDSTGSRRIPWTNNWNGVCNGGMTAMALAFANVDNEFREASEFLLDSIMHSVVAGLMHGYASDGGYPEGPGYWSYGTTYTTIIFSCLQKATGTTYGLINAPGFRESFYYIAGYAATSRNGVWNYHDAGAGRPDDRIYLWFATETGDKGIGGLRYNKINNGFAGVSVWDLLYYRPTSYQTNVELPLDYVYYGISSVTFRSSWDDNALFTGLHGGANNAPHGQLDIGNFIVEYGGTRFFYDLGADEYNLAGYGSSSVKYFDTPYRYWFYRNRAEGQNTLIINPTHVDTSNRDRNKQGKNYDQILTADSKILAYDSSATSAYAVVDMGIAYSEATSGKRGLWITDDRSTVIIQDEMTLTSAQKVMWMGHVIKGADITISADKKSAVIIYEGKSILCQIVVPEGYTTDFTFKTMDANYLQETGLENTPGEYSRDGMIKLVAEASNCKDVKLAIVIRLLEDGPYNYQWTNIDDWYVD